MFKKLQERGYQLFCSHIASKIKEISDNSKISLFNYLLEFFGEKVTPMEMKDKGTFAANRLANACIQTVENTELGIDGIDIILEEIFAVYNDIPTGIHLITGATRIDNNLTDSMHQELHWPRAIL